MAAQKQVMRKAVLTCLLILCSSCDDEAFVENRLVSGNLAASEDLKSETIYIAQGSGGGGYGIHRLTYELSPNDELNVSYSIVTHDADLAAKSFKLDKLQADRARQALWRVRPASTSQDWLNDWPTRPLGCERYGPHDKGEIFVVFVSDAKDLGASFEVPIVESCNTPAARQARQLLDQVINSFPRSQIAGEFYKAEKADAFQPNSEIPTPIPSLMR